MIWWPAPGLAPWPSGFKPKGWITTLGTSVTCTWQQHARRWLRKGRGATRKWMDWPFGRTTTDAFEPVQRPSNGSSWTYPIWFFPARNISITCKHKESKRVSQGSEKCWFPGSTCATGLAQNWGRSPTRTSYLGIVGRQWSIIHVAGVEGILGIWLGHGLQRLTASFGLSCIRLLIVLACQNLACRWQVFV